MRCLTLKALIWCKVKKVPKNFKKELLLTIYFLTCKDLDEYYFFVIIMQFISINGSIMIKVYFVHCWVMTYTTKKSCYHPPIKYLSSHWIPSPNICQVLEMALCSPPSCWNPDSNHPYSHQSTHCKTRLYCPIGFWLWLHYGFG